MYIVTWRNLCSRIVDEDEIMECLRPGNLFDLSSYEHREVFEEEGFVWQALGNIGGYLSSFGLGEVCGEVSSGAHLVNESEITIGEGSVVEPGAYVRGPCIIGKNCTIRHGAYIRGYVIVGDCCIIGHDTEMKYAIMLDHAKAAHFAYVGDSILGNHANLGAGTKCANLRFDNENIVIRFEGARVETELRKLGAILGDGTQTGCNVVANPGTITGKGVYCYPCMQFGGYVAAGRIIKPEGVGR